MRQEIFGYVVFRKISLYVKRQLIEMFRTCNKDIKLNVVFKSSVSMSNAFRFKDQIPKCPNSMLLYTFTCNTCNSVYIGKTKRHYLVCQFEHLGLSVFSNKALRYSDKDATTIRNSVNNYFLQLKESLLCLQLDREETLKYRCVCLLPYGKV